jgi:hypothetical protein
LKVDFAVICLALIASGCQSVSDQEKLKSCSSIENNVFSVVALDSLVVTYHEETDFSPVDLDLLIDVVVDIPNSDVAKTTVWYPNGYIATEDFRADPDAESENITYIIVKNILFENWETVDSIRQIPLNNYCLEIEDVNQNVWRGEFDVELPDGSSPPDGAKMVYYKDFGKVTGGGDFFMSMKLPTIVDAEKNSLYDPQEITITMDGIDPRVTEFEFTFKNVAGQDLRNILLVGDDALPYKAKRKFVFDRDEFTNIGAVENVHIATWDTGNDETGYQAYYSELGSWTRLIPVQSSP